MYIQGVVQLSIILCEEKEDHILAATAWALGQIGRHSAEHAKSIATTNVLPQLLKLYLRSESSEDLCSKVMLRCNRKREGGGGEDDEREKREGDEREELFVVLCMK